METDLLFEILNKIRPLSHELQEAIMSCLREDHFNKPKKLVVKGQVAFRLWFITEGFGHAFRFRNDKEETLWFAKKGDLFTADQSFLKQHPSDMNILIHKSSTLLSIHFDDLIRLRTYYSEVEILYMKLFEHYHMRFQENAWSRMYDTPTERFRKLLKSHPKIFQHVNQTVVASYLSISRRTLAKIISQS